MNEKEAFIAEIAYTKEAYEAISAVYENMAIDDLRVIYKYRIGWEKELIKQIGINKKANEDSRN